MQFTNEQKLIVTMLAEVHQALKIKDGVDAAFVAEAIHSGNEWAISLQMYSLSDSIPLPKHVGEVFDTLTMWSVIEQSYDALDENEKKRFDDEAHPYGGPKWRGFDGNNEPRHLSAARMLINHMGRFENLADRGDFNSHSQTLEITRRMLEAYDPIHDRMANSGNWQLSVDDLIEIFKARIHPAHRTTA